MHRNIFMEGVLGILVTVGLWVAPAQAHFVWVEAEATAPAETGQPIKVYFGEYSEFLREEHGGRLDSIDGVTLRVQDPKRGKTDVPLTKQVNHFAGALSSCLPGRNAVVAEQAKAPVQDLRKHDLGIVKPMFYARTHFVCLEDGRVNEHDRDQSAPLDLDLIPRTTGLNLATGRMSHVPGGEIVVKALFRGKVLPGTQVLVHAPIGWDKELKTDADGMVSFTPLWPGRYVLEMIHVEKTPGEFEGAAYEALRHRSTLALPVKAERQAEK